MKIFTKENEEITSQNDITEKCNFECNNEYVYELINILLKNPLNKINAYKYLETYFRFEYDDNDLLDYINNTYNTNYSKIYNVPTDETMILQICGYRGNLSTYNLLRIDIKCATIDNFNLGDRLYSIGEIEKLISNKMLFPIERILTNIEKAPNKINVYNENEDKINYLVHKSHSKQDLPYYSYFVSKAVDFINLRNVLNIVRKNIIFLYSYKINKYYEDMYYSDYEESTSEEVYFKEVYDLILSFNKIASIFNVDMISLDKSNAFVCYNSYWYEGAKKLFLIRNKFSNEQVNQIENDIIETADEDLFESIINFYPDALYEFNISKIINYLVERNILNDEIDEYRALEYLTYYQKSLNEKNIYSLIKIIYKSKNKEVIYEIKNLGYNLESSKSRSRKKKN